MRSEMRSEEPEKDEEPKSTPKGEPNNTSNDDLSGGEALDKFKATAKEIHRLYTADKTAPVGWHLKDQLRKELRERISEWTGAHIYTVDQVLQDLIDRSREKKLRLAMPANRARQEAVMLVTVHTMNCMRWTHREIPL